MTAEPSLFRPLFIKAGRWKKKLFWIAGAAVVLLLLTKFTSYDAKVPWLGEGDEAKAEAKTEEVVRQIQKHITLPEGDEPVIATIEDIAKLVADQPFYQGAENGDVLVIYPKTAKAMIYSPKRDVLVNVGPIQMPDQQPNPVASTGSVAQPTPPPTQDTLKVEVRNGTGEDGLAASVGKEISSLGGIVVTGTGDAVMQDYERTVIVNWASADRKDLVEKLTTLLGGTVVLELPAGEAPTSADVLVILGKK